MNRATYSTPHILNQVEPLVTIYLYNPHDAAADEFFFFQIVYVALEKEANVMPQAT